MKTASTDDTVILLLTKQEANSLGLAITGALMHTDYISAEDVELWRRMSRNIAEELVDQPMMQ